jgi:hypothetical protein
MIKRKIKTHFHNKNEKHVDLKSNYRVNFFFGGIVIPKNEEIEEN